MDEVERDGFVVPIMYEMRMEEVNFNSILMMHHSGVVLIQ